MNTIAPRPIPLRHRLLLVGLLGLVLLGNLRYIQAGAQPLHWDAAIHLSESLNANRLDEMPGDSRWERLLAVTWYYPPFVSYAAVPVLRVLGESEAAGLVLMTLFALLFVACAYGLAAHWFDSGTALLAATLLAASPLIVHLSRQIMLDLPLGAMVTLAALLLVSTRGFTRWLPSLAFGVMAGWGMLTKWTFPLFVAPLLVVELIVHRRTRPTRFVVLQLAVALTVAALVCAPWYLQHALQIATSRTHILSTSTQGGVGAALFYFGSIPGEMSWPLAILCVVGITLAWMCRVPHRLSLAAWFLGTYVLLTVIGFREPRFSVALLLPWTILASAGVVAWSRAGVAPARRRLPVACGAVALLVLLVGGQTPPISTLGWLLASGPGPQPFLTCNGPQPADWGNAALVDALARDIHAPQPVSCRVFPDLMHLNDATLRLQARLRHTPVRFRGTNGYPLFTDYIILTEGEQGVDPQGTRAQRTQQVLEELRSEHGLFEPVHRQRLPNGSTALLVRVSPPPRADASRERVQTFVQEQVESFLQHYLRDTTGETLTVRVASDEDARRGRIQSVSVRAAAGALGDFQYQKHGIGFEDLDLTLHDIQLDLAALLEQGELRLLDLGEVRVSGLTIRADDIRAYLAATARDVRITQLAIEAGALTVAGRLVNGPSFEVVVRLWIEDDALRFRFLACHLAGLPLPAGLVNRVTASYNPLLPPRDVPLGVSLGALSLEGDRITLGPAASHASRANLP